MNKPHFLNELRRDLVRQGLPSLYVQRVVGELADHRADAARRYALTSDVSCDAWREAERDLGSHDDLVARITGEYRARCFAGRHPWLTFVAAPIPLVLALLNVEIVLLILLGSSLAIWPGDAALKGWLNGGGLATIATMTVVQGLLLISPPALAIWLVCRWGRRAAITPRWLVTAVALIAITALLIHTHVGPAPLTPDKWMLGAGLTFNSTTFVSTQVLQLCLPLVLAIYLLRRSAPVEAPGMTSP